MLLKKGSKLWFWVRCFKWAIMLVLPVIAVKLLWQLQPQNLYSWLLLVLIGVLGLYMFLFHTIKTKN